MTQDEIIRMALEADCYRTETGALITDNVDLERFAALVAKPWIETNKALAKEIIELKKQAEQEPLAWNDLDDYELAEKLGWRIGDPLYMTAVGLGQEAIHHFKAKNTAPVRTKDLTDDEIFEILELQNCPKSELKYWFHDARAVIAAYKEKNK